MPKQRKVRKIQFFFRDLLNIVKYGEFPQSFGTLWINPSDVQLVHQSFRRRHSGKVINGDWDLKASPINTHKKIQCCKYKFTSNVSWEESGIIALMMEEIHKRGRFDSCSSKEDVLKRYKKLDELFFHLKNGKPFKTMLELNEKNFREHGGIVVHIGREGQFLFGGSGCHRMAIAQVLNLPLIPVQIGVCHPLAIKNSHINRIMKTVPL